VQKYEVGDRIEEPRAATRQSPVSSLQPLPSKLPIAIWVFTATIAITIVGLIIAAPLAQANGHAAFAFSIYNVFHFVCHQLPERSFHLAGYQFAVCARCTGLYSGFASATLLYPLARSLERTDTPSRIWLLLAAVPLGVDFGLGYFGIWENTHLTRFVTGALLSTTAVFYIMPGLIQLTRRHQQEQ